MHIGVDHFYVGFSADEINDLKKLAKLPQCHYRETQSGKNFWTGVYWDSASSGYFEMVTSPEPGYYQFGVALSAKHNHHTDIRALLKFYKGKRKLMSSTARLEGKRWFDAIYSGPGTYISASFWGMYFHLADRFRMDSHLDRPSLIERFTELELIAPESIITEIEDHAYWVPMKILKHKKLVIMYIKNKDRNDLKIKINIDKNCRATTFVKLRGECSPFQVPLPKLKFFSLKQKKGHIELCPLKKS